jgi:hypothetical protein
MEQLSVNERKVKDDPVLFEFGPSWTVLVWLLDRVAGLSRQVSFSFFNSFYSIFCFLFLDSNLILKSVVQDFKFMTSYKIQLIHYWYKMLYYGVLYVYCTNISWYTIIIWK